MVNLQHLYLRINTRAGHFLFVGFFLCIVGYWVAPWPLSTKDRCYSSPAWQPILPPDIAKDSWLSSQAENCGPMEIHSFNQLFFWDKVSFRQGWPWTCHIVEDDIVLLILLPPTSKCWNYMYMPLSPIYMVMGTELRILYMLDKDFIKLSPPSLNGWFKILSSLSSSRP